MVKCMKLVIVESPAKAKTINKYLGKDYLVMASFGHIRDVPAKNDSVRPNEDFAMDWEVQSRGEKTVREIVKAVAKKRMIEKCPNTRPHIIKTNRAGNRFDLKPKDHSSGTNTNGNYCQFRRP